MSVITVKSVVAVEMNTSPEVKSTEHKGARGFFRPDQHKDWGEEKIDALKKIFGKQVS